MRDPLDKDVNSGDAWDAIVIGAGIAGPIVARDLSQRGVRTLLVESRDIPREKVCGGCLNRTAISLLDQIGLGHLIHDKNARPLDRLRLCVRGTQCDIPLPRGRVVDRDTFDARLVEAARLSGVTVLTRTAARVLPDSAADASPSCAASHWRSVQLDTEGHTRPVRGRVIVVADGLSHSSLSELPEYQSRVSKSAFIGLGACWQAPLACEVDEGVHMSVGRSGYVGLVRTGSGRILLAAAIDPGALKKDSPREAVLNVLREAKGPDPGIPEDVNWRGTPPLTRTSPRAWGRRMFLVGDSAGYIEPFTGQGMSWAMQSALAVVPFVLRATATHWNDICGTDWQCAQHRLLGRQQWMCRAVAMLMRYPNVVAWSLCALRHFPLGIARVVSEFHPPWRAQECPT